MKNMIRISVLAGLSMLGAASFDAMAAGYNYMGKGGWRTHDGSGGWTQRDEGSAVFGIDLEQCKQRCDGNSSCKGIEYISNPSGWQEPNAGLIHQKCEIHHDAFKHCDTSFTGGLGSQDGCWVKPVPPPPGGGTGSDPTPPPATFEAVSVYNGSGCPAGSVQTLLSDNGKTASLLFNQFVAEKGNGLPLREGVKDCNYRIKVKIPNGWTLPDISVDYKGEAIGSNKLKRKYSIVGESGEIAKADNLNFPNSFESYSVRDELEPTALKWSQCGGEVILGINNTITADQDPSFIQLSTADLSNNNLVFRLGEPERCGL